MRRINFFIFCLIFFAVSFGVSALPALVPTLAAYFKVTADKAIKLTWLYMLPYGFVALVWAPLTRLVKVKNIFIGTTLGFSLSALLFSLAPNIGAAFAFRFLMGCFGCSFVPLTLIVIGKVIPPGKRSKYVGTFFAVSYLSTFISVFLSGHIFWRWIYLAPAVIGLGVFVLIITHLDEFDFRGAEFKVSYAETLKDKKAMSLFLVIILGSFLYHSFQQRLGVYLNQTYLLEQVAISSLFTVATFSAIVFEFFGGLLSSKFGSLRITKIGFMLMAIFLFLLLFVREHSSLYGLIVLWGAGWALTHVGLSSYIAHFPDKILRDASSLNSAFRFSFGGLGGLCGGILVSILGFEVFLVVIGVSIFSLGIFLKKIIG